MAITRAHVRGVVFLGLTGILAVVLIATLLLLGVEPRLVFSPGFAIKRWFEGFAGAVHNRVGVVGTVVVFWGAIVGVWLLTAKLIRRAG